ncbi:DUF1329 domain-containing protein [Duganella sp. Dugasp56]|uniref:DUF1329 domain-containing protein n=1 Tax=Duganella sp. Dugasp56 TaxID=3243046 RepID=UPI0039B0F35C
MKTKYIPLAILAGALAGGNVATAAVTTDEAAKLKSSLTPLGGEKAGNKDGSIPAWDGGWTKPVPGKKLGDVPVELFSNEKPIAQISAKNMAQYADKLSEGVKALMKKYPDTFRIDVYPTHRTAAAPSWTYENTFKNATQCKLKDGGLSVEGCYGGIPFPIPKDGSELIWNYLLRVEAESVDLGFKNIVVNSDGSHTLATRNDETYQFPYNFKDGSAAKWNGEYVFVRFITTAPPFKVGESLVIRDSVTPKDSRNAWQYLVGQRRVRRAPTVGFDTPDFVASGSNYFDEVKGFLGHPERYTWKLVGKKEMYIPYNTNGFLGAKVDEAVSRNHLNPDKLRWELHRVWEVEATIASGKRHAVPKRTFYFDEDTYILTLLDGFDAEGKLWRTSMTTPFVEPAIPAVVTLPVAVFNLQAGTMSGVQMLNEEYYKVVSKRPDSYFTGDAIAGDGAR